MPDPEKKSETFGECLLEWDLGAWVKDVAWSPSGNLLAVIAQDASVSVADVSQGQAGLTTLKLGSLPFSRVVFTSESSVVAAGYDCEPKLFQASAGSVKLVKSLDPQQAGAAGSTSNLKMWQNMDKKGETTEVEKLKTKHQNSITHMIESGGAVITSGLDGLIIFWPK